MIFGVLPEAELEADEAARWYDDQRKGLGSDFLSEIDDAFEQIRIRPEELARLETYDGRHEVRRCLGKKGTQLFSLDFVFQAGNGRPAEKDGQAQATKAVSASLGLIDPIAATAVGAHAQKMIDDLNAEMDAMSGEEGSNVFYVGKGKVMAIHGEGLDNRKLHFKQYDAVRKKKGDATLFT